MFKSAKTLISLCIVATGVFLVAVIVFAQASKNKKAGGLTLKLVPSQDRINPGVPVWKKGEVVSVIVMVTNTSDHAVHYGLTNSWSDWQIDVTDESGKPLPETEEFQQWKQKGKTGSGIIYRNMLVILKPGETGQDTIDLNFAYNLKSAGKYFIQVKREFSEVGKDPVESNHLEITIVR